MRTRGKASLMVDRIVESAPPSQVLQYFNQAVWQVLPHAYEMCRAASYEEMAEKRQLLEEGEIFVRGRSGREVDMLEVCKASTDVIQAFSESGELMELKAPSTLKQREASPQRLAWEEADRLGLDHSIDRRWVIERETDRSTDQQLDP